MRLLHPCTALFFATALAAQTQTGDIAITGFSTSAFGIYRTAVTAYNAGAFGGSLSQTILWDDQSPHTFWIAGFGFLGRAVITGPGAVSYAVRTTDVGIACSLSFDAQRNLVFSDAGSGQIRSFDPTTNVVTDITSGTQPWGLDLNSSVLDPLTGDLYAGADGAIYRLPAGSSAVHAAPVVSGLGGSVTGLQFDPITGELLATVLTVNRVVRIDGNGNVTDVCPPFSVPGPNALDIDQNGDLITGGGTGQVYRVPRAGGAPVFLFNNTSPFGPLNGLAVVGGGGYGRPFGTPCDGEFGPTNLRASGAFRGGQTVTLSSENHGANTVGLLVLGLDATTWNGIPLPWSVDAVLGTHGCTLWISADVTLAGLATGPGPASLSFPLPLPPAFAGQRFYAQHVTLENVLGGLSFSDALAFAIR